MATTVNIPAPNISPILQQRQLVIQAILAQQGQDLERKRIDLGERRLETEKESSARMKEQLDLSKSIEERLKGESEFRKGQGEKAETLARANMFRDAFVEAAGRIPEGEGGRDKMEALVEEYKNNPKAMEAWEKVGWVGESGGLTPSLGFFAKQPKYYRFQSGGQILTVDEKGNPITRADIDEGKPDSIIIGENETTGKMRVAIRDKNEEGGYRFVERDIEGYTPEVRAKAQAAGLMPNAMKMAIQIVVSESADPAIAQVYRFEQDPAKQEQIVRDLLEARKIDMKDVRTRAIELVRGMMGDDKAGLVWPELYGPEALFRQQRNIDEAGADRARTAVEEGANLVPGAQ